MSFFILSTGKKKPNERFQLNLTKRKYNFKCIFYCLHFEETRKDERQVIVSKFFYIDIYQKYFNIKYTFASEMSLG